MCTLLAVGLSAGSPVPARTHSCSVGMGDAQGCIQPSQTGIVSAQPVLPMRRWLQEQGPGGSAGAWLHSPFASFSPLCCTVSPSGTWDLKLGNVGALPVAVPKHCIWALRSGEQLSLPKSWERPLVSNTSTLLSHHAQWPQALGSLSSAKMSPQRFLQEILECPWWQ